MNRLERYLDALMRSRVSYFITVCNTSCLSVPEAQAAKILSDRVKEYLDTLLPRHQYGPIEMHQHDIAYHVGKTINGYADQRAWGLLGWAAQTVTHSVYVDDKGTNRLCVLLDWKRVTACPD